MGSLAALDTDVVLDRILSDLPDVRAALGSCHSAAWSAVPPRLLELCRLRIAMLLGCTSELTTRTASSTDVVDEATVQRLAEWPTAECFDDADRACLAFTEHYIIDVATLGDDLAAAAQAALGAGFASFVSALLVVEQRQRLRLTWDALGLGTDTPHTSSPG